ncbi:uncharacterized protein LOC114915479 [Cajanus cajan]|uniref:uncharacterized protein LOC114915479 n=1 Tax=Cajanus cajan TaxID=3821 RepID=UPI0010FB480E|nr:uncharacterized protein LOC114915479 [Cajanus cajan]
MERLKTRLLELDACRQAKQKDAKALKLAEMNRKNRFENFKNASELKPVNTGLKEGEAGYDPFSRRWTRSRNYYASKPGEKAAAANNIVNGIFCGGLSAPLVLSNTNFIAHDSSSPPPPPLIENHSLISGLRILITNMAEKVPSFKHCGASWFIDLATPDALYIFPVLTALSFLITVECNMQEGMEGNPVAGTVKNVSRGLAVLTVPFTMGFPKAIFCYWVTSNLFSRMYGLVLKVPGVKKTSGIPEIPVAAPTNPPQSPFSIFPTLNKLQQRQVGQAQCQMNHQNIQIKSYLLLLLLVKGLEV